MEALVALAGATSGQLQLMGNPFHLIGMRAICRRGVVIVFLWNPAYPNRAKQIHDVRLAHPQEDHDYGLHGMQ